MGSAVLGGDHMIGLVFTFEDDPKHDPVLLTPTAAERVREAISIAVNFVDGISVEEITDAANAKPKFALIFNDLSLVDAFTARLSLALIPTTLRISNVSAI